jgi:solute carrier family 25 (peroxisomal adenine nucleotide transporter), member 17
MNEPTSDPSEPKKVVTKQGFFETVQRILANDGASAFWRGIGPALVLVVNPVLQYTVFEQLKNVLITKRTAQMRAAGIATAVAVLTDRDYFLLGAISKLGETMRHNVLLFMN